MSDPTGGYEVTTFSGTLEAARDHLETGTRITLSVEATMEADQLKLLARGVQPIDQAVDGAGTAGLRVFVKEDAAIASVASLLARAQADAKGRGRGAVSLCLLHPELPGEVEMALGATFPVTPQLKGAIKSLNGVIEVEDA